MKPLCFLFATILLLASTSFATAESWGGRGVGIQIDENSHATLSFDCAIGHIPQWNSQQASQLTLVGTHQSLASGMRVPPVKPAIYRVEFKSSNQMLLQVDIGNGNPRKFDLLRGKAPIIHRCMIP